MKYTGLVAAKKSCAESTTVASPHVIPGYNWWVKLVQASECESGLGQSLSTQLWPFKHISFTCLVPCEAGDCQIPSVSEAVVFGMVGMGVQLPSGRGTVRWDGREVPSFCGIIADGVGRLLVPPMTARPMMNL